MTGRLTFRGLLGLFAVLIGLVGRPIAGAAQEPLRDNRNAGRVEVTHVGTLRFQNVTTFAPDIQTQVVRLPDGGWGAISHRVGGSIALFSAAGSPNGTLGRAGSGPGEFETARFAMGVGEELWVIDPGNNRLTAFGSDGTLIGGRRLPGPAFWVAPTTDREALLLSGFFGTPSGVWHTVARVTMKEGDDRFGGDAGTSSDAYVQQHVAAETPSGEIWAVARSGGDIQILRPDDLELMASSHLPENLSQPERHTLRDITVQRPPPVVYGVTVDGTGTLWIVMWVADAHWRPLPGVNPLEHADEIYDSLILAVSPQDRAIVGAKTLDRFCLPVVDALVSCVNEDAETVDIWRLSLER